MTDDELSTQAQRLRDEADAFMARHGVLDVLRRFGTPHVSGSYAMRLMTWRDLDIYLDMPDLDVKAFLELGRELGGALRPRKLSFTDHLGFPATEGVRGLYWGIRTDDLARGGWKMDLWGVASDVCAERLAWCEALSARIDDTARRAILRIKNEVCRVPGYRDVFTSQHVYDAVLAYGAATVDDFWRIARATR